MKQAVFRLASAALSAVLSASASMIPAGAADTAKPDAPQEIASVVKDFEPLSGDTFTLNSVPDVPMKVVISEAVQIATKFSTDSSGSFVNGMLAGIVQKRGMVANTTKKDA